MTDFKQRTKSINLTIAAVLKKLRIEQTLSMTALAGSLGVDKSLISKCENENRRIDLGEFLYLCAGLNIEPITFIKQITQSKIMAMDTVSYTKNAPKCCVSLSDSQDFRQFSNILRERAQSHLKDVRNAQIVDNSKHTKDEQQPKTKTLSMRMLADRLGMPHSFVGKVEQSNRRLDIGEFIIMCDAMNQEAAEVLRDIIDKINDQ